jgi:hypothetical protein
LFARPTTQAQHDADWRLTTLATCFVTTVLLPAVSRMEKSPAERVAFFDNIERRFAWQARVTTLLAGLSGLYMLIQPPLIEGQAEEVTNGAPTAVMGVSPITVPRRRQIPGPDQRRLSQITFANANPLILLDPGFLAQLSSLQVRRRSMG